MRRTPNDWTHELEMGLKVTSKRGDEIVVTFFDFDSDAAGLRLRIIEYHHRNPLHPADPPLDAALAFANENAVALLDLRDARFMGVVLPEAHKRGKKSDDFYKRVLESKQILDELGEPYAERLATDNRVNVGVVYRWVTEAKRREAARAAGTDALEEES